uniref:Uncharacterized protein n=1 Tax=Periophthalmus magnuspinnatus TaxID=409849 RepID=A0A3B3ZT37_9GOBI
MCSSYNLKHCSIMAPLIDEYDRHIKEMMEELQKYQVHLVLHTELRESVERQLHAIPVPSATKGSAVEEDIIIKNLQEQIQLSEQQAMELWKGLLEVVYLKNSLNKRTLSIYIEFEDMPHKWNSCLSCHTQTNQQFLKTLTEQTTEMEELQSYNRQSKAELRTATAKVNEMTKLLQNLEEQMQRREEDVAEAQGRENAADRRLQQLQSALGHLQSRLNAATQEAESVRREQSVYEKKVGELQTRCTTLEEEKYAALTKVRESIQAAEEGALQKEQALLREKQKTEELEKTKETIKQLIQDAAVRTRKEVENVRKQCSFQILRMTEELSALQSLRERKAVEEELEKVVYSDSGSGASTLPSATINDVSMETSCYLLCICPAHPSLLMCLSFYSYSEELSRCQEEVRRLQNSLTTAREECVSISEERLKLQQENIQLRKDMDDLRKSNLIDQKKAKQWVMVITINLK